MRYTVSLKDNRVFRRLYSRGNRAVTRHLAVYSRRTNRKETRLGLSVGTKIGCAVVRNRIKRRFREIYRLEEPRLKPGYDLVIVARHPAATAEFSALREDLLRALAQSGLYVEDRSTKPV